MSHNAEYMLEGNIMINKQGGHFCNTGAEMKQVVEGDGSMRKFSNIYMQKGFIEVLDNNDWFTGLDALQNLGVTTVIRLCAPGKFIYDEEGAGTLPIIDPEPTILDLLLEQLEEAVPGTIVPPPVDMGSWEAIVMSNLEPVEQQVIGTGEVLPPARRAVPVELLYPMLYVSVAGVYDVISPLTSQVFATSIIAQPGHLGSLHTGFDAAYGPYAGAHFNPFTGVFTDYYAQPDEWRFEFPDEPDSYIYAAWGPAYVGNYFTIQQYSNTTYGLTRRLIDISSPFSHAYFFEATTIAGAAEIREALAMVNLLPGQDDPVEWSDLF